MKENLWIVWECLYIFVDLKCILWNADAFLEWMDLDLLSCMYLHLIDIVNDILIISSRYFINLIWKDFCFDYRYRFLTEAFRLILELPRMWHWSTNRMWSFLTTPLGQLFLSPLQPDQSTGACPRASWETGYKHWNLTVKDCQGRKFSLMIVIHVHASTAYRLNLFLIT